MQEGPSSNRWSALLELANKSDVVAPAVKNLAAKAEHRARASLQKRHKHSRMHIAAAEVLLAPGLFLNEDGSSTTILSAIQPGASSIKLVDESEAIGLLQALRSVQPDELGLLVLGHSCPAPDECNGHLTFPHFRDLRVEAAPGRMFLRWSCSDVDRHAKDCSFNLFCPTRRLSVPFCYRFSTASAKAKISENTSGSNGDKMVDSPLFAKASPKTGFAFRRPKRLRTRYSHSDQWEMQCRLLASLRSPPLQTRQRFRV